MASSPSAKKAAGKSSPSVKNKAQPSPAAHAASSSSMANKLSQAAALTSPPSQMDKSAHRKIADLDVASPRHALMREMDQWTGALRGKNGVGRPLPFSKGGAGSEDGTKFDVSSAEKAADELVSTEKTYVHGLKVLCRVRKGLLVHHEMGRSIISPQDAQVIFQNITDICSMHLTLYRALKELRGPGPTNLLKGLGATLLEFAPFIKMHTNYVLAYEKSADHLRLLREKNWEFDCYVQWCLQMEDLTDLESLMITPIQRTPRYLLLVKDILRHGAGRKNSNDDSLTDSIAKLEDALKKIAKVASDINESFTIKEARERLLDIDNRCRGLDEKVPPTVVVARRKNGKMSLVTPSRSVVKEGVLEKENRNAIKLLQADHQKRYFVLCTDLLLHCLVPSTTASALQLRAVYDLTQVMASEVPEELKKKTPWHEASTTFLLETEEKKFVVKAPSAAEKDSWMTAIRESSGLARNTSSNLAGRQSKLAGGGLPHSATFSNFSNFSASPLSSGGSFPRSFSSAAFSSAAFSPRVLPRLEEKQNCSPSPPHAEPCRELAGSPSLLGSASHTRQRSPTFAESALSSPSPLHDASQSGTRLSSPLTIQPLSPAAAAAHDNNPNKENELSPPHLRERPTFDNTPPDAYSKDAASPAEAEDDTLGALPVLNNKQPSRRARSTAAAGPLGLARDGPPVTRSQSAKLPTNSVQQKPGAKAGAKKGAKKALKKSAVKKGAVPRRAVGSKKPARRSASAASSPCPDRTPPEHDAASPLSPAAETPKDQSALVRPHSAQGEHHEGGHGYSRKTQYPPEPKLPRGASSQTTA